MIRSNYTSRQQGNIERLLQTILLKILKLLDDEPDLSKWSSMLGKVELAVNSIPHSALRGRTPYEIGMRRPPFLLPVATLPASLGGEGSEFRALAKLSDDVRAGALRTLTTNKQYYLHSEGLKKGQCVWRKRQSFGRHMAAKLQVKILHGYEVEERIGTGMYRMVNIKTGERVILPCDQIIRTKLTKAEMLAILDKIEEEG